MMLLNGKGFVAAVAAVAGLWLANAQSSKLPGKAEGAAYLEKKKKEDGVITLPSGMAYKVLRKGDGKFHPTKNSPCDCHYKGMLVDEKTVFDSSYDRGQPTTFAPNQVIAGWTEAMQLMVEGDKWEMYIPPELAYGPRAMGDKLPASSTLIFQMEILKIKGGKVPANEEL